MAKYPIYKLPRFRECRSHFIPRGWRSPAMVAVRVGVENFVRAETDRMFSVLPAQAGGVNQLKHNRPELPVGQYELTVRDVPVDGFWSISPDNADGFFQANDRGAYTVNNITARPNEDGSVTVQFGGCSGSQPNCLPIMEGRNYTIRLCRPRPEVLDGSWVFPRSSWPEARVERPIRRPSHG